MKTPSKTFWTLACVAIWLLAGSPVAGQGTFTVFSTLRTGANQTLTTATQTFNVDLLQPANRLQFAFGFATEEQPGPGQFLDSATVTFQDAGQTVTLVCLTVDGNGVVWAPVSPGATFLDPNDVKSSPVPFNDQTKPWVSQVAYSVIVPIPAGLAGESANLYLDLFDNGDSRDSLAWISEIPEPGTLALLLLGGCLWLRQRKVRP